MNVRFGSPHRIERMTYVLDQCTFVFESITLAEVVELVVKMLVNLA